MTNEDDVVAPLQAGKPANDGDSAWIAVCAKWGTHHEEPCDSLDEALAYLWYGTEHNLCLALGVIGPDGPVYAKETVYEAIAEYEKRTWS